MTQCDRLLHALQASPDGLTSLDITKLGILRGGARLKELRDAGYVIETHRYFSGSSTLYRYTLASEPRAAPPSDAIAPVAVGTPAALGCEDTLFDLPASIGRSAITGKRAA